VRAGARESGWRCRVKNHELGIIYSWELGLKEAEKVCPILSGVGDAGRFGARDRWPLR